MKRLLFILFVLFTTVTLHAQVAVDTATVEAYFDDEDDEEDIQPAGASDTSAVEKRSFSSEEIQKLKADEDLQYKEPPTVAESLWDRFMIWLDDLISSLFSNAANTNWGRLFTYVAGIIVLIAIIMLILKIDAFKVFTATANVASVRGNIFEENIHEIDFDSEIQKTLDQKDYRRGVRLVFLYALKLLSDKQHITWEQGKTNHDYVAELKEETLQRGLHELSYYFDYAWYGNFVVSRELFDKVNFVFVNWKGKIR